MDQEVVIEFEVDNPKLISINEQYIHPVRQTKSGRYYSYFAKSPYLVEVQEYYKDVLKDKISDNDIKRLKDFIDRDKTNGVSLTIEIGIPLRDIRDNDASNFIKSIEDCIVDRTKSCKSKVDDSCNYEVTIRKSRYESEDNHMIIKIIMKTYGLPDYLHVITDEGQIHIED